MPGLMARWEYKTNNLLAVCAVYMTVVLIETLIALGAEVTWSSCNIFSRSSYCCNCFRSVYVEGLNEEILTGCEQTVFFGDKKTINMILDDGGNLTMKFITCITRI
jgi:adenosylhomocysteinase